MKRNLIIVTMIALIASACSTSVQMSGKYVDDLYYWPGDTPPEVAGVEQSNIGSKKQKPDDLIIISEVGKDSNGTNTLNNYIYADDEPDWYSGVQAKNIENLQNPGEDTLYVPSEDGESYIINNYYLGDDSDDYYSYSDRIRFFHDPYYISPYISFNYNWGWGGFYSPYYGYNYWDPWYYNSWYSPWGYRSWYYDPWYYNSWGYNSYYGWGGYYGHGYYPGYHDHFEKFSFKSQRIR